jgi:hypothetical protein
MVQHADFTWLKKERDEARELLLKAKAQALADKIVHAVASLTVTNNKKRNFEYLELQFSALTY